MCLESPSDKKDAGVRRQWSESGLGDEIRDQGGHRGEAVQAAIGTGTFTGNESEPLERSEQRRSSAGGTALSYFSRIVTNIHFFLCKSVSSRKLDPTPIILAPFPLKTGTTFTPLGPLATKTDVESNSKTRKPSVHLLGFMYCRLICYFTGIFVFMKTF